MSRTDRHNNPESIAARVFGAASALISPPKPFTYEPSIWEILDYLEVLELDEDPFAADTLRKRAEYVTGLRIYTGDIRQILSGRVSLPSSVTELLMDDLKREGGISGSMIREPVTETSLILTPSLEKTDDGEEVIYHELTHVLCADPVPVDTDKPFPPEARHKLRVGTGPDGRECQYWQPLEQLFDVPPIYDYNQCEDRAEKMAGHLCAIGARGGDSLREVGDYFWR